jgi:diaminopropionate ammonia-lyase
VGAGSIAQAVTKHFKNTENSFTSGRRRVLTVEHTTAACLKTSLEEGEITVVPTEDTIMCGMNCGTISSTAWPILRTGVDACIAITDFESHQAVEELKAMGIKAGPCGAATLAALRHACQDRRDELGLLGSSRVILFCTEGPREYEIPQESR